MYAAEGTVFAAKLVQRGLLQNDPIMQNHSYQILDIQARRVYVMLKEWHRSHSMVYDWVIDSLTAPKVLVGGDHEKVYQLYRTLQSLDLEFFEIVLNHVIATKENVDDLTMVREDVIQSSHTYGLVENNIAEIYRSNQLSYNAVPNPFLGST
jgi:anaerobic magnesium-protoporphyrin IX monomethyl ester cyclase